MGRVPGSAPSRVRPNGRTPAEPDRGSGGGCLNRIRFSPQPSPHPCPVRFQLPIELAHLRKKRKKRKKRRDAENCAEVFAKKAKLL